MEEIPEKKLLDLNDVVKYNMFDAEFIVTQINISDKQQTYNIRLYKKDLKEIISPETLQTIENTEIPRNELIFIRKDENKKETKALPDTLKKQLFDLHTKKKLNINKKLIVIISINTHGSVLSLDTGEYQEKFPYNFKHTFWKNIGVCGKIHYATNNISKLTKIHNSYIDWIKSLYKSNTAFKPLSTTDGKYNIIKKLEEEVNYNIDIKLENENDNISTYLPNLFYTHTPKNNCKNYYTCNPEYIPYINKPYIDTPYYADKKLSFDNEEETPLYITIIDGNQTTTITCNKTNDFKKINTFISNFIKQKKSKDLDVSKMEKTLNDIISNLPIYFNISELFRIFELLEVIDYDIDLFLLDYSCSTIGHNIDPNILKDFLNDKTISKGGKRQTRKNKRKHKKTNRRKKHKKTNITKKHHR